MAAAVQTNLSVAFTHGAQLTMDHCGALIHGAAILWSRLPSQLPQETLLLCTPVSRPLTPFRWELVSTARPARAGDTVAILFVSMLGERCRRAWVLFDTLEFSGIGLQPWENTLCVQYVWVFGPVCSHAHTSSRVFGSRAYIKIHARSCSWWL